MALTPWQINKINEKKTTMPQAMQRDPTVDYYHGWFFVTLCTDGQKPVLSTCEGNPSVPNGLPGAPYCSYSELGEKVKDVWNSIPDFHKGVVLDMAEFMPEHMHGLLYLKPDNKEHLGKIIGGFMGGCSHAYWDTLGIDWRKNHPTCGAKYAENKSAAAPLSKDSFQNTKTSATALLPKDRDRDHTHSYRGPALFVHGYNDMEPITAEEVEIKRAYIRDQARKRVIQGDRHQCFKKHRHAHSRNWTVARCMNAVVSDRCFLYDAGKREKAMSNVLSRLNRDAQTAVTSIVTLPSGAKTGMSDICLDYIGNNALLYSKKKLPLVCHSADAWQFERQKEAVLKAAREGIMIVSAFISQKERDIKTQLMVEQLPFIEVVDNGFSDKYKGIGKAFYALAENRLLQITPWSYLYQKDGAQVTREMCMVMNELARVISGVADDWWKQDK